MSASEQPAEPRTPVGNQTRYAAAPEEKPDATRYDPPPAGKADATRYDAPPEGKLDATRYGAPPPADADATRFTADRVDADATGPPRPGRARRAGC
jgi:hypothetical protein